MTYEITKQDVRYWNAMGGIAAGVAMVLAVFVLGSALWIYQYKAARSTLDRISFRIVLWSMAWEVVYSINYLIVCGKPEFVEWYAKTNACIGGAYVMIGTIGVNNWLCTCIAVNLMMSICFNRNPISLGLEKWYVIGSTVLGLGVPIVPAAIGHLGYDPDFGTCYFTSDMPQRMRYLLLDLYLWQGLSCIIATVSVIMTMACLIKHGRATRRLLVGGNTLNRELHRVTVTDESDETGETTSGSWCLPPLALLKRTQSNRSKLMSLRGRRRAEIGSRTLQDRLLEIALKISLYPVALIVVNGVLTAGDLFLTGTGGVNSRSDFILFLAYNFLYGGRGIIFACLGIFVDPCLARGFKAVLRIRAEERQRQNSDEERDAMPCQRNNERSASNSLQKHSQTSDGRRSVADENKNSVEYRNTVVGASSRDEGTKHDDGKELTGFDIGSNILASAQPRLDFEQPVSENGITPATSFTGLGTDLCGSQGQTEPQPPAMRLIRRGSEQVTTEPAEWEEVERLYQEAQAQL
ncbi:hypothetical protein IAU59_002057 [Kwoniella sp. CBS 9459]